MGTVVKSTALDLIDELRRRGAIEVSVPTPEGPLVAKFATLDPSLTPKAQPTKPMTAEEQAAADDAMLFASADPSR